MALADPFGDGITVPGPDTRRAWRQFTRWGKCEACGHRGPRQAHHVVLEQIVERHGGNPWALRNRWLICDRCHAAHHTGGEGRLSFDRVPTAAVQFAVGLMGEGPAALYFSRRYRPGIDGRRMPDLTTNQEESHG